MMQQGTSSKDFLDAKYLSVIFPVRIFTGLYIRNGLTGTGPWLHPSGAFDNAAKVSKPKFQKPSRPEMLSRENQANWLSQITKKGYNYCARKVNHI